MAEKKVLFHDRARSRVLRGARKLYDTVKVTLGPRAKCVLLERSYGKPLICDDGVTIAKEFELECPEENLGAQVIRDAAEHTGDEVGDGTTTSTILAYRLFHEGLRNVTAGAKAIEIKRGLELGLQTVVAKLRSLSCPVETETGIAQVATIAAHNDSSIGKLIAEAMTRVGKEGAVSIEEARGTETSLEVVEGMQLDRGYLSPYFVTDSESMEAVLDNPLILLYEKKLSSLEELLPLLEDLSRSHRSLLVIAENVEGDALAALVLNKLRGVLNCVAIKAPGFGDRRQAIMDDLAILTGGRFVSGELGIKLEKLGQDSLGTAERVTVTKETTTIVGGGGERTKIERRCLELRRLIDKATSDYEKEQLEARLAKLAGGVAVIRVGAPTEAELKNLKEAFDDAVNAARAAASEGIVPGCGLAFLRAIDELESLESDCEGDHRTALRVLKRALEEPTRQIAANAGEDEGVVVFQMRHGTGNFGFDGATSEYCDLLERGIVDPTKVVVTALQNAVSVASMLLLTEATLTHVREKPTKNVRETLE